MAKITTWGLADQQRLLDQFIDFAVGALNDDGTYLRYVGLQTVGSLRMKAREFIERKKPELEDE